ncbi:MAG: hypothetical protein PW734_08930 [Verrucomicrobium sp.]|nr:hypothetical protein [Verrucomicrobium sp.]
MSLKSLLSAAGLLLVAGVLLWQACTQGGAPDPARPGLGSAAVLFNIAVLVFREGLECVLVLAALTSGMTGPRAADKQPVFWGVGAGLLATLLTWIVAARIVTSLGDSVPALDLQAATGLVAIAVLMVIMNWFFHKIYWGGWIALHHKERRRLAAEESGARLLLGLGLLGFTSLYREGFEIVLFLQGYYLQLGGRVVAAGAAIGLLLTGIVAVLTFLAHRRLPYRRMLVVTGLLLGLVFLVMVGEQAQEMQLAGWIPTTKIPWLEGWLPDWAGLWFSLFPTAESLAAQAVAAGVVIGSYFLSRWMARREAAQGASPFRNGERRGA